MTRKLAGAFVALGLTAATAFLSRVPVSFAGADAGVLRLSWRNDAVSVESCRAPTEEELARLPVHMRAPTVCSGAVVPYALRVALDGRGVLEDTIRASGARGDRPLYVFREVGLAPGVHELDVRYRPALPADQAPPEGALFLDWSGTVDVDAGRILLVTLNERGEALEVR